MWALSEECDANINVVNHSHICWAREYNGQSALFKNPLNSAQILAGNLRFLNNSTDWYRALSTCIV